MALSPFEFDQNASNALMGGEAASSAMSPRPRMDISKAMSAISNPPAPPPLEEPPDVLAPATPAPVQPAADPVVGYNFQTKEVFSGGKVFDGTNGTVLDEYNTAGFLDQDNSGKLPPGFDPVPASQLKARLEKMRGGRSVGNTVGEVFSELGTGVTSQLPAMVNQAGAFFSPAGSAPEQFFKDNAEYWENSADPADMLGRSKPAQLTIEAARNAPASLAAMGSFAAGPAAGAATTMALFGGAQAQTTFDKVMAATGDMSEARKAAWTNFFIEGGGEAVGDWVGAKFLAGGAQFLSSLVKTGKVSVPQAVAAATNPAIMKRFVTAFAGNTAVQSGTEFAQNYGETAVENAAGVPYQDPMAAGTHGAGVGAATSVLMGPLGIPGAVAAGNRRAALGAAINNPDNPTSLLEAAKVIHDEITGDVPQAAADGWLGAQTRIANAAQRRQDIAAYEAANPDILPVGVPTPAPPAPVAATTAQAPVSPPEPAATPAAGAVQPTTTAPPVADPLESDDPEPVLPQGLSRAAPRYKTSQVQFASDVDRAAYIANPNSATQSAAQAQFMEWLQNTVGMSPQQIAAHAAAVKTALKSATPNDAGVIELPALNIDSAVNTGMPVSGPGSLNSQTRSRVVSALLDEGTPPDGSVAKGVLGALDEVVDLSRRVDRVSSRVPPRDAIQNKRGLAPGDGNWAAALRDIATRLQGKDNIDALRREFEAVRKSIESSNKKGGLGDEAAQEFNRQLVAIRESLPPRGSLNKIRGVHAALLNDAADALDKLVPGRNLTGGDFVEKDTGDTLATLQTKLKRAIDNLLKKAQGTTKKDQRARAAIEKLVAEFKARKETLNAALSEDEYGDFEYDRADRAEIEARDLLDRHISMAWNAYKKGTIAEIDETGRHTDRQLSHVRDTPIRKAGKDNTEAANSPLAEAALSFQMTDGGPTFTGVEAVLLYLRRSGTAMEKTLAKLLSTSLKDKWPDIQFLSKAEAEKRGIESGRYETRNGKGTVYITRATPEVVLHELMHAATAQWVVNNPDHDLVKGLSAQMGYAVKQLDQSWFIAPPGSYKRVVAETFTAISETEGGDAHRVSEFIAYAMTRNDFQHFLQQRKGVNMDKAGMGYTEKERTLLATMKLIYKFFTEILHKLLGIKGVEKVNKGLENTRKFSEYLMNRIVLVVHESAAEQAAAKQRLTLEHRVPPVGKAQGVALEGKLFGGALDNSKVKDQQEPNLRDVRRKYNDIRSMLGLEPVTDWSRLPKDLVQNIPDDDVSFNHTSTDKPGEVNQILQQVRGNGGNAYVLDSIFAAPFKMLLPGLYGRNAQGIGNIESKVSAFTADFLKAHPALAYWSGKIAEYVGVPQAAKTAIKDVYKLVRGADSALGNRMEDALREIPAEEAVRIVEALQSPVKLNQLPGEYRAIVKEVHDRLLQLRDEAWSVGGLDPALRSASVAEMIQWAKDKSDIASSGFSAKTVGIPKNFKVKSAVDDAAVIWGPSHTPGTKFYPVYTVLDPTKPDMFIAETERAALASYGADTTMAYTFDKKVGRTMRFVRNSTYAEVQAVRNAVPLTHYLANTIAVMSKVVASRELVHNLQVANEDAAAGDKFIVYDRPTDARVIDWGSDGQNLHYSDREAARRPDVWVKAPAKFGLGKDAYVNGSVFGALLDLNSGEQFITSPTYNRAMRFWKGSKTKWSPATHMTNTISNLSMVYLHDIPMRAVRVGASIMAKDMAIKAGRKVAMTAEEEELLRAFNQSGALLGNYSANELNRKLSEAMAEEFDDPGAQVDSIWSKAKTMIRYEQVKAGLIKADTAAGELYQFEDNMFRFAAFITELAKQKERGGKSYRDQILTAGAFAKYALIDYDISAKGINALRQTVLPFLAWPYRAIPMLTRIAYQKPWKMAAMMSAVWGINALGYAATGGDEDKDRKTLDKWMRQKVWGIGPSAYVRMPWGDPDKPVFMGLGKFIPNGDLVQQTDHGFMGLPGWPAFATPTGPLLALLLAGTGWDAFQGRSLWSESASYTDNAMASFKYLTNQLAPNLPGLSPRINDQLVAVVRGKRGLVGNDLNGMYTVSRWLGSRLYEVDSAEQGAKQGMAIRALVRDYRSQIARANRAEARFDIPDFEAVAEENKERAAELLRKIKELQGEE